MSYKASTKQKKLLFLTVEGGCLTNSTCASRLGLKIQTKRQLAIYIPKELANSNHMGMLTDPRVLTFWKLPKTKKTTHLFILCTTSLAQSLVGCSSLPICGLFIDSCISS